MNSKSIILKTKIEKNLNTSVIINEESITNFYDDNKDKEISIVIPSYNSEKHISKCLDSIIKQTFPFSKIEVIVVDDGSTDDTQEILKTYAKKFDNIIVVLLKKNTGTPAIPRNIGIKLASAEKIMFLDSDDWLSENGLQILYDTMTQQNDDFVVGRTIKVTDNKISIHAEFISYENRYGKHPLEIPYLLYHLGPPSKLIKTSIIKVNDIMFPELKFAEDKSFFIEVLSYCNKVSTLTEPVCYINRYESHKSSLTRSESFEYKRKADYKVLKNLFKLNFDIDFEKEVVKRIIEYDLIRSCNSFTFIKSENQKKILKLIRKAFKLIEKKTYNIIDWFDTPVYKVAAELIINEKYDDALKLFKWLKTNKSKKVVIKDKRPHFEIPFFPDDDRNKYIEIPLYAKTEAVFMEKGKYTEVTEIFGNKIENVSAVIIRDKRGQEEDKVFPITIVDNKVTISFPLNNINDLNVSHYGIYIRYDGYKLLNIVRESNECVFGNFIMMNNGKEFMFYTTQVGNLGLAIK